MTHLRRRNSIAVVVVGEQLFRPSWSFQLSFIQSATIGLFTRQQKNKPNYTHNQGEYRSPRIVRREAKRETYRTGELGAPGRLASRGGMGCQRKMRLQSKPPTWMLFDGAWLYCSVSELMTSITGTTTLVLFSAILSSRGSSQPSVKMQGKKMHQLKIRSLNSAIRGPSRPNLFR